MEGDVSLESFFDTLDARVQTKVWSLRVLCLLLFLGAPYLVLQPIALAPERVPCVGQVSTGPLVVSSLVSTGPLVVSSQVSTGPLVVSSPT